MIRQFLLKLLFPYIFEFQKNTLLSKEDSSMPAIKLEKDDFIVADSGKNELKAMVISKSGSIRAVFSFPSISKKVLSLKNFESSSNGQMIVEFGKGKYIVGEGVQSDFNSEKTKLNEHHQLCIYTAIGLCSPSEDQDINLVVGIPTTDYQTDENIELYKEMLCKKVNIKIQKEQKSFNIDEAKFDIYPEGMALFPRSTTLFNGNLIIIDIGGQNINYRKYDNKGNTMDAFSLDFAGMNKLTGLLAKNLRESINGQVIDIPGIDWDECIEKRQIEVLDDAIQEKGPKILSNFENSRELIDFTISTFIEDEIIAPFNARGVYLRERGTDILFTGGGSLRLKPFIENSIGKSEYLHISKTARWDNCLSYAMRHLAKIHANSTSTTRAINSILRVVSKTDFENELNLFAEPVNV